MQPQSPESRFFATLGTLFLNWLNLETFHHAARRASGGDKVVAGDWLKAFGTAFADPNYGAMLKQNDWLAKPGMKENFAKAMGTRAARLASTSVDSAALIFAHTILDEAMSEACRISFAADPKAWWRYIDDKEVKLKDVHSQSIDEICHPLAEAYVTKIAKSSMTDRLKHLNRITASRLKGTGPIATASIDFQILYAFDQLRHRLVHRNPFKAIRQVEQKLLFAKQASFAVLWLVAGAYGLHHKKPDFNDRAQKRLCVILRREFREFFDLVEASVAENQKER
jgi:hypothetical protein